MPIVIFEPLKFFRSPIVTGIWYLIVDKYLPNDKVILKIGLSSTLERISVESWKALYKPEPGKFENYTVLPDGSVELFKDRGWVLDRIRGVNKI